MEMLVSTSKSILAIDCNTGKNRVIHSGKGLYYGIAYSEEAIFVAARNNNDCFDYLGRQSGEKGEILTFDFNLRQKTSLNAPFALRDMHQLLYADDRLWATCCYDNMLAVYDGRVWQRWYPSSDPDERGRDVHHFNSLYFADNNMWVLGHNFGPSTLWRFSYPNLRLLEQIDLGNQAHNIWIENGEVYACNSQFGSIVSNCGRKVEIGGFTRGVVVLNERIYIGASDIAEQQNRAHVTSSILVFDRKWRLLDRWLIEGHGQLLDMRVPGVPDACVPCMCGKPLKNWEILKKDNLKEKKTRSQSG